RGLLWWMGSAALNLNDDATLTEAVLRLDSLDHAHSDKLAGAAADFLRAFHLILNGDASGLSMALRGASLVQDSSNLKVDAWARYELCDAYTQVGEASKALPVCTRAANFARAVGDDWELADDQNDLAWNHSALKQYAQAVALFKESRKRFRSIGANQVAAQVGDNLSHTYILTGHPRKALALSRASLVLELAAGRDNDALLSRDNIARAYAALGQPKRAMKIIEAAIHDAEHSSNHGLLPRLYAGDSQFAEAAGDLKHALASARKVSALLRKQRNPSLLATEKVLENRYQQRERELRIRTLEHQNRNKTLELEVARARTTHQNEVARRQQLWILIALLISVGLLLVTGLLYLLLRSQRHHANALRQLALRDPLTGVDNRRAFMQTASEMIEGPRTYPGSEHALLLLDLDHFKAVNDTAGHPAGDRVLSDVVNDLELASTGVGRISRLGGEEFALLCPRMGAEQARRHAAVLCHRIATLPLPLPEGSPIQSVTISIGVAILDGTHSHDIETWLRAADYALYKAKAQGRNRVVLATPTDGDAEAPKHVDPDSD
ncbi:GGDEF domain-containing protein, partial [Oleiagrimonas sp.]|uniref:tetratricopeptide repeat-containing diguanylate cyclase n=1 Tax=Oleiagrimonas sp. TaxID=2010330 RepID=UPI0026131FA2